MNSVYRAFYLCVCFSLILLTAEAEEQKQSRFLKEINLKQYPQAQSLSPTPQMRWDFSADKIYSYNLKQKTVMQMTSSMVPENVPTDETTMEANVLLQIKSQANGTARIVLEDLKTDMQDSSGGMKMQNRSPSVIQGFREDSSFKEDSASNQIGLGFLFTLPPRPMAQGETIEIPVKLPFNAMGSVLEVQGSVVLRLVRYVTINNHTCAQFESDIDVSKIDIPPEVQGKYSVFFRGKATSFFDVQERRFVSSTVAMLSHIMAEKAAPDVQTSNEPADLPETISMSMMNDALIEASPTP